MKWVLSGIVLHLALSYKENIIEILKLLSNKLDKQSLMV